MLNRLKGFLLALLVGAILSGGIGLYFYTTLKAESVVKIKRLESDVRDRDSRLVELESTLVSWRERTESISREGGDVLKDVVKGDRDYLDAAVPDGVQSALQRAYCLQVPNGCPVAGAK